MTTRDCHDWLVVRLSALGDVTLTTGVIEHLAKARGDRFHFLTRAAHAPVLMHNPHVGKIVVPEEASLKGRAWPATARRLASHYQGWGLLDLHGNLRSRILRRLWKGPMAGYPKKSFERRVFDRFKLSWAKDRLERHNVPQRYAMALLDEPPSPALLRPRIHLTGEERAAAAKRLADAGLSAGAVALHPYATHAAKAWPREQWLALIDLIDQAGEQWFVIGRSKEGALLGDDPRDFSFETDIRETCALLETARALVTNDSGPMHLATGVGSRVVALFGPTHKAWGFFPSGENDVVLEREMTCRPCHLHGGRGCRRGEICLRGISPLEVLEALKAD